jgi:phosphatidylglycerophosphate synthase
VRFVFPNVVGNEVAPIEIKCRCQVGQNKHLNLSEEEIKATGLDEVRATVGILACPIDLEAGDQWSIRSLMPQFERQFAGKSAQLAGLLAMVAQYVPDGVTCPLEREPGRFVVWATGQLDIDDSGSALLLPVGGGDADEKLARKFEKFKASGPDSILFLCARADATHLVACGSAVGVPILTLDAFLTGLSEHQQAKYQPTKSILAIEPRELRRFLAIFFAGLYQWKDLTASILFARAIRNAEPEALTLVLERTRGLLHMERSNGEWLCLFEGVTTALAAAQNLRKLVVASVSLDVSSVQWNAVTVKGDGVRVCRSIIDSDGCTMVATQNFVEEAGTHASLFGSSLDVKVVPGVCRTRVFALTSSEEGNRLDVSAWLAEKWSRPAAVVACVFTATRMPLGAFVAWAFFRGRFTLGLGLYAAGLFTDVFDGWVARRYNGETSWGKRYDAIFDMFFNASSTIGYMAGALYHWGNWLSALAPVACTGGLVALSRPWIEPGSLAAKIRSGVIRAVLIVFVLTRLKWNTAGYTVAFTLIPLGLFTLFEEVKVMIDEKAQGVRDWLKGPKYRERRPDQRLLGWAWRKILGKKVGATGRDSERLNIPGNVHQ